MRPLQMVMPKQPATVFKNVHSELATEHTCI